jgi:hypothetical protein
MSASAVARLRRTVALILNTERYGGTLQQRDDSTLILRDFRCMSMHLLDLIHEQFPQVDITVQAHEDSAAGFVVIFVLRDSPSVVRSSTFAQGVILAGLVALALSYDFLHTAFFVAWI